MSTPRAFGRTALGVLYFAVVYLPLEEFLLKWAPGGSTGYAVARLGFESLLYAAVAVLAAGRAARGLRQRATPLDLPLLVFLALATASLLVSDGSRLSGLINLRVLLRYVATFYLVVYLELRPEERQRVLALLFASAVLQGVLGIVQHLQGGANEFWLPRTDLEAVGGVSHTFAALEGGFEQGSVIGTTDHAVAFALFLLVAGTLAAAQLATGVARGRGATAGRALVLVLACAGILFSYSRATLFALGLALAALAWMERGNARLARLWPRAVLLGPFLAAGALLFHGGGDGGGAALANEKETEVTPLASVESLFTREYLESAQSSRLWILGDVGKEIACSAGWLGFGPDEEYVKERLLSEGGASLYRLIAYKAFEDVYWVALLAYYGFLGLAAFLAVLARLAWLACRARARARDAGERAAAEALLALLLLLVPLGFVGPTFDFRTFSFYFWLLAGLVVAQLLPAPAALRAGRARALAARLA